MDDATLIAAGGAAVLLGALLYHRCWGALDRRQRRRRWRRAQRGEAGADAILRRAGGAVTGAQVRGGYELVVDGAPQRVEVIPDRILRRRGRRVVAEVKTGAKGPDPLYEPTRRQLLEYALAFEVSEIWLVDMETEQIRRVRFPLRRRRSRRLPMVVVLAAGLTLGSLAEAELGLAARARAALERLGLDVATP
jgi:hypothetical protein